MSIVVAALYSLSKARLERVADLQQQQQRGTTTRRCENISDVNDAVDIKTSILVDATRL